MEDWWPHVNFQYPYWIAVTCILAIVQMMTDEFFFGGASIGAILTSVILYVLGPELARQEFSWSLPYIMCGIGGLAGATLMRLVCKRRQEGPDINDEPYDDERS